MSKELRTWLEAIVICVLLVGLFALSGAVTQCVFFGGPR